MREPSRGGNPRSKARETHAVTDHSFAPTEFPKRWSTAAQSGPRTHHARRHTPLRRRVAITSQHPEADTGESTPPKGPCKIVANRQPSTEPGMLPAWPGASRASVPNASRKRCRYFRYLPATNKRQELRATAVGELTRVDIACRHLGRTRADKKPLQINSAGNTSATSLREQRFNSSKSSDESAYMPKKILPGEVSPAASTELRGEMPNNAAKPTR